jgi:DNA primase
MGSQTQMTNGKKTFLNKEEKRQRLNRLKAAIDADRLLESLGFDIYKSSPSEIRAPCKIHGGDNKTAFRMNKQTKNWICFSHGCHEEIGYDVISLVMHLLGMSFPDAIRYLENISGINIDDDAAYLEFKREKDRKEFIDQMKDNRQVPTALVSEEYLKSFRKFRSNFFEQSENGGFPAELLELFEIGGGYVDKYGFQRDVIPIRGAEGDLRAYSCRDITGKADEDYKYLLTKGFDKDKVLYNLFRAKEESRTLIVVEGFKSVWKLRMAGYNSAVACMGSMITPGQQNLLYSHAEYVITLLDGDAAGIKGTIKAIEAMKGKIRLRPIFFPYEKKDPADLDIKELRQIIGGI